jgi:hypothetical protein
MELRFQTARTTKDLDFTVRVALAGRDDILLKEIQDAGAVDLGDSVSVRR